MLLRQTLQEAKAWGSKIYRTSYDFVNCRPESGRTEEIGALVHYRLWTQRIAEIPCSVSSASLS